MANGQTSGTLSPELPNLGTDKRTTPQQSAKGSLRSEQIIRAAVGLFQDVGYQNVSIDQIGAAVGLTGPAVYRHFKGKHAILVRALVEQVEVVEGIADRAVRGDGTPEVRLRRFLDELSDLTTDRDETMLWRREQLHLQVDEKRAFRAQFGKVLELVVRCIAENRADLTQDQHELLAFALLSMYATTKDMRAGLVSSRVREIQIAIAEAIIRCPLPTTSPDAESIAELSHRVPAGRRERIIDGSAGLFDERGFYDVRIEDIAKASGMSQATLYQHISSKAQVLQWILERGAEGLQYVTAEALAHARSSSEALDMLIRTYIEQAFGVHGRNMRILATDLVYLPDDVQASIRDAQREYVAEWTAAICEIQPELTAADARAIAQAVIGVITDLSQTKRVRTRRGLIDELRSLATAMTSLQTLQ